MHDRDMTNDGIVLPSDDGEFRYRLLPCPRLAKRGGVLGKAIAQERAYRQVEFRGHPRFFDDFQREHVIGSCHVRYAEACLDR